MLLTDKAERVAHYARNLMHEVCMIAHSCGLKDPRELRRWHCRVVCDDGISRRLDELYPYPATAEAEERRA